MSADRRRRQGERIRTLEERVRRLRAALERYASEAAWEPMGNGLYAWFAFSDEEHPADVAQRALLTEHAESLPSVRREAPALNPLES